MLAYFHFLVVVLPEHRYRHNEILSTDEIKQKRAFCGLNCRAQNDCLLEEDLYMVSPTTDFAVRQLAGLNRTNADLTIGS